MPRKQFSLDWQLGMHAQQTGAPDTWIPAKVPGAVQLDWAKAHGFAPYIHADHYKDYLWMEDVFWTYRTRVPECRATEDERVFFVCGGVDYQFEVLLKGEIIHAQEGMFTPFDLELTGRAEAGDVLEVRVFPAPKSRPVAVDASEEELRSQADHSCKPAVSYKWDFHPRLIPLGIWQDTYVEVRPSCIIAETGLDYRLSTDLQRAEISDVVCVEGLLRGMVRWELLDPAGHCVIEQVLPAVEKTEFHAVLENPQLWWPHDQGQPLLYTSRMTLMEESGNVLDWQERRVGFRKVRLVMNESAWNLPDRYPMTRSAAPMTLEINGRKVFAKGSNWVSPHIFPGKLNRAIYEDLLTLAREANMNILRCWGGAPVQKSDFFDLCDEMGIMLWQEFPLACNNYPDDEDYLRILDQESRSIIRKLKHHPSIVLWCGGNELFNNWSMMTEQSLALRLLDSNCLKMDPERPFIMTSPLNGAGHGPYYIFDHVHQQEAWPMFQQARQTAYCEFGCTGGMAPAETLREIIPPESIFPPRPDVAWVAHHAYGSSLLSAHLTVEVTEQLLGAAQSLEDLVEKSQLIQGEVLKGMFEEVRRQKMAASMAINWCFNEPWPAAANCSIVAWPAKPKSGLAAVKDALRPALASLRIPHFQWQADEQLTFEVWMLNDAPAPLAGGDVSVWLRVDGQETRLLEWSFPELPAASNLQGPQGQALLPEEGARQFELLVRVAGRPELDSVYTLALK